MLILAFDTSAAHCAATVMQDDFVVAETHEPMTKGQAERLLPICEDTLARAGISWSDLDGIGVGIGPGNFTGIRIAVSAARGLALSIGKPAIGVSTLEAQAFGITGMPVLSTIDARQDKIYMQIFEAGQSTPPALVEFASLPDLPSGCVCVGHRSGEIAKQIGATARDPIQTISHAIGSIAATRIGTGQPRPAPLYIRLPDAAPPRDTAPEILDA